MRFKPRFPATLLAACGLLLAGAGARGDGNLPEASLYERIGGAAMVETISNDLIDRSANDPRTERSWRKVNLQRVKQLLSEQLCSLSGGPCAYSGDSMKEVHAGLNITEAEMYALVESLRTVMVERKIKLRERNEMLALLAPMKRDVVTK